MNNVTITFTVSELQTVVDGLSELPAKRSMSLIQRVIAEHDKAQSETSSKAVKSQAAQKTNPKLT